MFSIFLQSIKFSFSLSNYTFDRIALCKLHQFDDSSPTYHCTSSNLQSKKKIEIFLFDFFISKVDKPKTFFVCIIITKSFQRLYHTRCMFGYDFLIVKLFRIWIFKATTILTKITAKKKQDSLWLIEKIRGNSVFDVRDGDYCRNEEKKKRCFRFE